MDSKAFNCKKNHLKLLGVPQGVNWGERLLCLKHWWIWGGVSGACPPYGTQFFRFHIHFHQKVPTLEVHAPPNGCTPPLREILDPPLYMDNFSGSKIWFSNSKYGAVNFKNEKIIIPNQTQLNTLFEL